MTFKLSELIKLPEKKEPNSFTTYDMLLELQGYNQALSDLANMEIEVDEEEFFRMFLDRIPIWLLWGGYKRKWWHKSTPALTTEKVREITDAIASQLPKMLKEKK